MPIQIVQPQQPRQEQPKPDIFDQILKGLQIAGGITGIATDLRALEAAKANQGMRQTQFENEQKGVLNPMQQAELASKGLTFSSGDEGPMPQSAMQFQTPEGAPLFAQMPQQKGPPPKLVTKDAIRDGRRVSVSFDPTTGQEHSAIDLGPAKEISAPTQEKGTYKEYTDPDGNIRGGIVINGRLQQSEDDPIVKPASLVGGGDKGKQIPAGVVSQVAQFDAAEKTLADIDLKFNRKGAGLLSGVTQFVPGTDAAEYDDDRRAAAQTIGTILEGGKLTDPDFEKYMQLLPSPSDSDERAANKINTLSKMIKDKKDSVIAGMRSSGYDAEGFKQADDYKSVISGGAYAGQEQLRGRAKPGMRVLIEGKEYKVGQDGDTLIEVSR